ncbi:MAG TPA: hypothetical protein VGH43_05900 [Jatrophihabitans sp.]|jgi:hypothetical protein
MTVEPISAYPADNETTGVISANDKPLPPYAHASAPPRQPAPMSPLPPTPPPPARPAPTHPQSVADAMVEISMPPLAADSPSPTVTSPDIVSGNGVAAGTTTTLLSSPATVPSTTAGVMPPPATEVITCPECGTVAKVTLNRRESVDFCRNCDYPLFWTPSKIVRGPSMSTDESLRRLPGQAGRVTIASLPCPFCYEPNALSAQTCIRCGKPMHPVEEAPPAPVYVAPPPAPVVVEEPSKVAWWVWALLALGAAALITLIVLIGTGTIN